MNRIIARRSLPNQLISLEISTSLPLDSFQPGQYIICQINHCEAAIALPVVKINIEKKTVTIIFRESDVKTAPLVTLPSTTVFHAIKGFYGQGISIRHLNAVLCIADEKGMVPMLPVLKALKKNGVRINVILSAPSPEGILLQEEVESMAEKVIIYTQESSCVTKKGLSQVVAQVLHAFPAEEVIVMGSARSISDSLKSTINSNIPSQAILYAGTAARKGIHGIFRVTICGNVRSVCVDGHDFNAYYATFDELMRKFEAGNCQGNEQEKKEVCHTQGKLSKHPLQG